MSEELKPWVIMGVLMLALSAGSICKISIELTTIAERMK